MDSWRTFWTQSLSMFDIFTNVHFDSHICLVAYSGHFCFLGDFTKQAITIAGVDRFYWNLAFCLQLDVALFLQNFAKIQHCLPELWKCIQWFTFFPDTVYIHISAMSSSHHGYTRLSHSYLLAGGDQPECPLTIKHILIECSDFRDIHNKYFHYERHIWISQYTKCHKFY